MTTTLSLFDAQGILTTLMETRDHTLCSICSTTLGPRTYMICRFPDGVDKPEHEGHTACETCAKDRTLYVGEGGSCKACFDALGGRRTAVAKSGVALIPPVLNAMANTMISGFLSAEKEMKDALDAKDSERIAEGAKRRAAAVEEVRRRRVAAEKEATRLREAAEQESEALKSRAAAEAARVTEEAKERAAEEAARVTEEAKKRAEEEAARVAAETQFAQQERTRKLQAEDDERRERIRVEDEQRANVRSDGQPRKRKPQSEETVRKRMEASNATRAEKKRKIARVDEIASELSVLETKYARLMRAARDAVERLGGDPDELEALVDHEEIEAEVIEETEEEGLQTVVAVRA